MANISSAYGAVSLTGDWTKEQIDDFNIIASRWRQQTFSIDVAEDLTLDCHKGVTFLGDGRHAFHYNLTDLNNSTENETQFDPALKTVYNRLLAAMELNGLKIRFDYVDKEPGNRLLQKAVIEMVAEGGVLTDKTVSMKEYPYTWDNLIDLADQGGVFEEFVGELAEYAGIEPGDPRYGKLYDWARVNTGGTTLYDGMSSDVQAEFMRLFKNT